MTTGINGEKRLTYPSPVKEPGGRAGPVRAGAPFVERVRYAAGDAVISVAVSQDGRRISAASIDGRLHVLTADGTPVWRSGPLTGEAWCTSLSADGTRVAVGTASPTAASGAVTVFDATGRELFHRPLPAPVRGVDLSADGRTLAVATWRSEVRLFRATTSGYQRVHEPVRVDGNGCYGIRLLPEGDRVCVSASDHGLSVVDFARGSVSRFPIVTGLYNVAFTEGARRVAVACGDGKVRIVDLRDGRETVEIAVSTRPVCGVSATSAPGPVLTGCLDGRVQLMGPDGEVYWRYATEGEVWSTALSADASVAVIGSGDGSVSVLENRLTTSAFAKLRLCEQACAQGNTADLAPMLGVYSELGLLEYGQDRFARLTEDGPAGARHAVRDKFVEALRSYLVRCPTQSSAELLLADLLRDAGRFDEAIAHYQHASTDSGVTAEALISASACFERLGMPEAARVSARRVHSRPLGRGGLMPLYNLGREYQDRGDIGAARSVFETVVAWNVAHRDAMRRAAELTGPEAGNRGPDVPSPAAADSAADRVFSANARQSQGTAEHRARLQRGRKLVNAAMNTVPNGEARWRSLATYLTYDFAPPRDQAKKWLDVVHSLARIEEAGIHGVSLDIGTATARYPGVLRQLGFQSFGVDLELEAIRYARSSSRDPLPLAVGDATRLPFRDGVFDLVTCMMGTLSHLRPDQLPLAFAEVVRVLRPSGHLICSTWDPTARNLDFLAMYTQQQKEMLRRNLCTRERLAEEVARAGLTVARIEPFCVFPDFLGHEVATPADHRVDLQQLIDLDLAYRATVPDAPGQMFMLAARKPAGGAP
ncbi:methyltransferase domain-containing protein [Amycolatopsis sp. NPDC005003]